MMPGRLRDKIQSILKADLPAGESIVRRGRALAREAEIGRTAFLERVGAASEAEYKRRSMRAERIMARDRPGLVEIGGSEYEVEITSR